MPISAPYSYRAMENRQIKIRFFRYVVSLPIDRGHSNFNLHWRPQVSLCNPCAVNYDFVVRFETINEDETHLLRYLQRNDREHRKIQPKKSIIATNRNVTSNVLKKIGMKTIEKLMEIYSEDFKIMGYNYTRYLDD